MSLLAGKRGIIFGVANDKSIAWGISQALSGAGAELAFTYLNGSLEKRVRPLAESLGSTLILSCDVQNDEDIDQVFTDVEKAWGGLDFVIHSVAFADREDLKKPFSQTSRAGFALAMDVSAYSLVAVSRRAAPLMKDGGSIVTLSYLGAQRAVPNYNVMGVAKAALEASVRYLAAELGPEGIRVNAISAGPIRTLAASGIGQFKEKIKLMDDYAPLRRTVTQEEVGKSALYFVSDLASGVTGEVHFVDAGFNVIVGA
ncbi:Enoyl-[acyl-carrier-protein] reductase [NADH] [Geoalkalibacter ferrihydriticus]|uniref:Enoyl-[acyl-carrier-protein] reductase [NADH] n=2 Tax=Geoalkalibacter ferrihydriticus TaxID=392333 RepID=A0A0C2HU84_9BACT|nr:enoyl-ACP reductase [Geoalkalibacter ferrihydriticus]KIH76397.1 enoyl-ACP reductase [Geoalkalibacter ferrihydriticus DSM 17813]SDL92445.1 Enoyl-[acyl-carrier-protein] reductase [NADH] [Geoalkalibacter ferrihydriticus]